MMRAWRATARALSLCALASLGSCSFSGLNLTEDRRVRIESPKDGAKVSLPLTITWSSTAGTDVQYAVFVDRKAIKPGDTIKTVGNGDRFCELTPSCPDDGYLKRHGVYVVSKHSVTLTTLYDLRTKNIRNDTHQIVIVVMKDGMRDGEGFFSRTVTVRR